MCAGIDVIPHTIDMDGSFLDFSELHSSLSLNSVKTISPSIHFHEANGYPAGHRNVETDIGALITSNFHAK